MKISKLIKQRIDQKGAGSLWDLKDFKDLPIQAVVQTLSRLAKQGVLTRVRKGIYYYPTTTVLGPTTPSVVDVITKIASHKTSKSYFGDTTAFNNLGLTTQVPAQLVILGNHQNKTVQIGNQKVVFRHRKTDHLKNATDQTVWALDAIRNIHRIPDTTAQDALAKVIQLIQSGRLDIGKLLHYGQQEPPRVRALLGAIAQHCGYDGIRLTKTRNSLNPVTKYKLGLGQALPTAQNWNIV